YLFGDAYPERYFNMGIAELGTMAAAAGMAADGRTAIVCGYGVFLTMRALEAVRSFICYPKLNVKIFSSHGGVTAAIDGVTHQATEDIAFMSTLPGMVVLVPSDSNAARAAFDLAVDTKGPVFVRLMRDPLQELYPAGTEFRVGGSHLVRPGTDLTIASYGDMLFQALEAANLLASEGISAEVIDFYSIKPWDQPALAASLAKTGALLVAENHQQKNGFGYELAAWCMHNQLRVPFGQIGLNDTFAESGSYQMTLQKFNMDAAAIVGSCKNLLAQKNKEKA
ncbi:MAG: transketolase family protein, partial [Spirochaetes bacterium]|nr:transketolase family protein [Spirochaetota bacterium]